MTRIIIIEPSPIVRAGIKKILEDAGQFDITGMYGDLPSFKQDKNSSFDVLLVNPAIIHIYKQFSARTLFADYTEAVAIAIFYGYVDSETLGSFDGVLDIYSDEERFIRNLQKIIRQKSSRHNETSEDVVELSEREKEILTAVAAGLTNKEIADKYSISIHTVISHRKNITRKTGIKTVSGLTIYAVFNNLISQ
ncbi:MAG: response regulator transcription factor [Bacteroidales bacterium]|jgi:DNA-binding NarL/FixJ family response regulator|nr:response regulator transcription factor [Bacteroidales bacterium]